MSEPKRYAIRGFSAALVEEENGKFVRWEDYAKLDAEKWRWANRECIQRVEELEAQVCELTKEKTLSTLRNIISSQDIKALQAEVKLSASWQPMETAPLDGTDVLCVCIDPEFEGEDNPNEYIRTCFFGLMTEDYRCWMSVFGYEENPTHWMPLPAKPLL